MIERTDNERFSSMFTKRLNPDDVFTPRSPEVNPEMYVSRSIQEAALERALKGSKNIVIFGESGCGKSWLYKRKLASLGASYLTANMANVSRLGSVTAVFADRYAKMKSFANSGEDLSLNAGFNLGIAKLDIGIVEKSEKLTTEPFEQCLAVIGNSLGGKRSYIVLENIESIIEDSTHVRDLASLITLVDDEDYAQYNTRLIIVGVPDDIQRYLSSTKYGQTISNRIVEIPEVERLSPSEAEGLLNKGFRDLLKYKIDAGVDVKKIGWHTDYIPQHLHELGLEISHLSHAEGRITSSNVAQAIQNWIQTTMVADSVVVETKMNARETKAGRRNQTIYTLAHTKKADFKVAEIEAELRAHFPKSTKKVALNVTQMLSELSQQPSPLVRRTPKGDAYRFVNPKLKVCARAMLLKSSDETVEKVAPSLRKI